MPVDISRSTFEQYKHYSGVRQQMGRVQLDADWNEQVDIIAHRTETEAIDVIGPCGAPIGHAGFRLTLTPDRTDLAITPGRIYVDGLMCELDATSLPATFDGAVAKVPYLTVDGRVLEVGHWVEVYNADAPDSTVLHKIVAVTPKMSPDLDVIELDGVPKVEKPTHLRRVVTYFTQPDYPLSETEIKQGLPQEGAYLAHLLVRELNVTTLDDQNLTEIALGGPDTATRTKIVWQVRLLALDVKDASCDADLPPWDALVGVQSGRLQARTTASETGDDPCLTPPGGGFNRAENQLYRVEIHAIEADGSITFKWSRDNGAVAAHWTGQNANDIQVNDLGPDAPRGFADANYIELTDDARVLRAESGTLVKVSTVRPEDSVIVINPAEISPAGATTDRADFALHPRVRRWEGFDKLVSGWIALEDGVEVQFEDRATFRVGDYWLIPARAAIGDLAGDVLWPRDVNGEPLPELPDGVDYHYCKLGVANFALRSPDAIQDCRPLFPPLTGFITLNYVGGDGQEAMPGNYLPQPVQVAVRNGKYPVVGAAVRFTLMDGEGALAATSGGPESSPFIDIPTDAQGIALCFWRLGRSQYTQRVHATLHDTASQPTGNHPVRFSANQSIAAQVAYSPGCEPLGKARTVQEALDLLCKLLGTRPDEEAIHVIGVQLGTEKPLVHNAEVSIADFLMGIVVTLDRPADPRSLLKIPPKIHRTPNCFVTLDVPFTLTQAEATVYGTTLAVVGFRPLMLADEVRVADRRIFWLPMAQTRKWIEDLQQLMPRLGLSHLLVHLTLRGNYIWDEKEPEIYLDGEAFGVDNDPKFPLNLRLPSGDAIRGGDFEMWFWLRFGDQVVTRPRLAIFLNTKVFTAIMADIRQTFSLAVDPTKLADVVNRNSLPFQLDAARVFDPARAGALSQRLGGAARAVNVTVATGNNELDQFLPEQLRTALAFKFSFVNVAPGQLLDMLRTGLATGNVPEVIITDSGQANELLAVSQGLFGPSVIEL